MTEDHVDLMIEIKKYGNNKTHVRPSMKRTEWNELAISILDDPTDSKDIEMVDDLLTLMEKYYPVNSITREWILK